MMHISRFLVLLYLGSIVYPEIILIESTWHLCLDNKSSRVKQSLRRQHSTILCCRSSALSSVHITSNPCVFFFIDVVDSIRCCCHCSCSCCFHCCCCISCFRFLLILVSYENKVIFSLLLLLLTDSLPAALFYAVRCSSSSLASLKLSLLLLLLFHMNCTCFQVPYFLPLPLAVCPYPLPSNFIRSRRYVYITICFCNAFLFHHS